MTSLVLILAIFMRRRREGIFFQRMWLMSPETRKMRRNVVMQELVLHIKQHGVLAKELENLAGP